MSEELYLSHEEMAIELGKLAWAKQTWLDSFSTGRTKRADHEIETRQRELIVLRQAERDYSRAAERVSA